MDKMPNRPCESSVSLSVPDWMDKNFTIRKELFISSAIISHGRFPTYVLLYPMVDFQHVPLYPSYQLWCKIFFLMVPFVRLGFHIRSSSEMNIKNVTAHE
jgi:hypothetical protein